MAGSTAMAAAAASAVPQEAVLSQLTDMGFDAVQAQQALARMGPHLEMAVSYLLGQGLAAAMGTTSPHAAHAADSAGVSPAAGAAASRVQEQNGASPAANRDAAGNDTDEVRMAQH